MIKFGQQISFTLLPSALPCPKYKYSTGHDLRGAVTMIAKSLPSYEQLKRPLAPWHPKAVYYSIFRLLLRTVGRLSQGIRIGLKYGFDSGVMLEYVYCNQPCGISFVGRLIDRIYLNSQGWVGIRQRGEILKNTLRQILRENRSQGKTTRLLDVACGGGRYDLEVLMDFPATAVSAVLRDYKGENVDKAQELADKWGISATIERADAFSDEDLNRVVPPPNLIVVSGLHEILPDDGLISHHFQQLYDVLEAGGYLVFTIQPYHPQLELIARTLNSHTGKPWVMRLRSRELCQQWASAAGFHNFEVQMDDFNIFGVVRAQKY